MRKTNMPESKLVLRQSKILLHVSRALYVSVGIMILCLMLISGIFPEEVQAGMVYGRVSGCGQVKAGDRLTLVNAQGITHSVTVGTGNSYSVDVPPGVYKVTYRNCEAWIESFPQPMGQDINLRPK